MNTLTMKDVSFSEMTSHSYSRQNSLASILTLDVFHKKLVSIYASKESRVTSSDGTTRWIT
jgi:hypothetical protein